MVEDKIIGLLRENEGYLSGEEISRMLDLTRAAVWKHVQELRAKGFDIVAVPHLGYQLMASPDKLFPSEIRFGLPGKIIGKDIHYFETTTSTMDEAFTLGLQGCPEGTVVCAEGQSRGRGRLGRTWMSPKSKGIYMSIVLRPKWGLLDVAKLTLLSAVALAEAIREHTGLDARIKWPNDVQIDGKKAAGILTELSAEADRVKFIVVGIGVNVNTPPSQIPDEATSLRVALTRTVPRVALTRDILKKMEEWYLYLQENGFSPVAERWRELSVTLHQRVRVVEGGKISEGEALDIDGDGGLLLRDKTGTIVKKMAGDVITLRRL